ncbi:hypothetical protein PSA7680_01821 [Pseudoruegeria aquimaris]|uniref:DUF4381 domain-containing protein n=1 Tax=Pseudoruegeria aquimaris TaxID=393663 RepID=A0A1Y5SDM0_9RHOB|nr:DUF4381 domain-containing protein [Pseudoruegeria aquimaris]SLN37605.1 hypothetical protein PSA7680_01821 [Pseudoruegeria aquimaris]
MAEEVTSLAGMIDTLNDVAPPAPISMLPQTGGWIVAAVAAAALLAWLALRLRRRRRAEAYRRAARAEFAALAPADLAGAEVLLRRTAIAAYGRARVAGLQGEAWLAFLEETCPGAGFRSEAGRALAAAPYAPDATGHADAARALAGHWITGHRREAAP